MRILIVKLSSIGDIVHALPALAVIRSDFADAEISWAVDKRFAEILRGNTVIDHLFELDLRSRSSETHGKSKTSTVVDQVKALRTHKFDIAIDLQGLLKSALVARASGAKKRWGFSGKDLREPASRFFYTNKVTIKPQTHVIHKNMALAACALDIDASDRSVEFPIYSADAHKAEAKAAAAKAGGHFVILNPAGGWVTKLWPAENYGILADEIYREMGLSSLIAAGPNDSALLENVLSSSKSGKAIAVQPSLKGFYELSKLARCYVGGDTGPTHIAAAAGTPVVGIFGPTEWWRNGSLDPDDICVERTDIGCRLDCHRRTCSKWICMNIGVETVLRAVKDRLEMANSLLSSAN